MSAGLLLVPYKAWKMEQAERVGVRFHTFERWLDRGKAPMPVTVRFNARVVFVCEEPERQAEFRLAVEQPTKGEQT